MGKTIHKFAQEMSVIMPRMMREFVKRQPRIVATGEISLPQMAILHILKEKDRCMMSELAKLLSVTTSAATGIVDRMVKTEFLKRFRNPNDRRIVNVQITPKGERAINAIFKQRQKMMIDVFKHFSSSERETYLGMVKKIYHILRRERR